MLCMDKAGLLLLLYGGFMAWCLQLLVLFLSVLVGLDPLLYSALFTVFFALGYAWLTRLTRYPSYFLLHCILALASYFFVTIPWLRLTDWWTVRSNPAPAVAYYLSILSIFVASLLVAVKLVRGKLNPRKAGDYHILLLTCFLISYLYYSATI